MKLWVHLSTAIIILSALQLLGSYLYVAIITPKLKFIFLARLGHFIMGGICWVVVRAELFIGIDLWELRYPDDAKNLRGTLIAETVIFVLLMIIFQVLLTLGRRKP